jgi:hypothetical protein
MDNLFCWKCGADLKDVPQPFGRRAACPACGAELHVCRMCRHYDTAKAKQCRERAAEPVNDKARANFCDWFQPRPGPWQQDAEAGGRGALDDLFGGSSGSASPKTAEAAKQALDDLFGS